MVRASNPPGTLPFTVNIPNMSWSQVVPVGYPFDPDFLARTGPCDYFTVAERVQAGTVTQRHTDRRKCKD